MGERGKAGVKGRVDEECLKGRRPRKRGGEKEGEGGEKGKRWTRGRRKGTRGKQTAEIEGRRKRRQGSVKNRLGEG